MATKEWKELEGKIFRIDVASTTEEALKNENPAVISFTTDGDIVFNGEKFCKESEATTTKAGLLSAEDKVKLDSQNKTIKMIDIYVSYEEISGNYILNNFGVDGCDPVDYPSDTYTYQGEPITLRYSKKNGSDFIWFSRYNDYDTRVSCQSILGITEEELNSDYNSLDNGFIFNIKLIDPLRYNSSTKSYEGYETLAFITYAGMLMLLDQGSIDYIEKANIYDKYNVEHIELGYDFEKRMATKDAAGYVIIGEGINVYNDDISDKNGTISLAAATSSTLGGVKKAALDLQSEYEFLKAVPTITDIDEAKMAINHLRVICKTLVDKLEAAGTLTK